MFAWVRGDYGLLRKSCLFLVSRSRDSVFGFVEVGSFVENGVLGRVPWAQRTQSGGFGTLGLRSQ